HEDECLAPLPSARQIPSRNGLSARSSARSMIWPRIPSGIWFQTSLSCADGLQDSEFIAASPTGSIPAIRDGNVRTMESCAILEYLVAKYPPTRDQQRTTILS